MLKETFVEALKVVNDDIDRSMKQKASLIREWKKFSLYKKGDVVIVNGEKMGYVTQVWVMNNGDFVYRVNKSKKNGVMSRNSLGFFNEEEISPPRQTAFK